MGHKTVKVIRTLILCGAVSLPQLALADLSQTNPSGLGIVHGMLEFCTRLDPGNTAAFDAQWQSIVGDTSKKALTGFEQNSEYRQGHDSITDTLSRLPKGEALKICAGTAALWLGAGKHGTSGTTAQEQTSREAVKDR